MPSPHPVNTPLKGTAWPTDHPAVLTVPTCILVTAKVAIQYCKDPRKDKPTAEQLAQFQFIVVEDWFNYPDFNNYHGPSNLAHIIRFNQIIEDLYRVRK